MKQLSVFIKLLIFLLPLNGMSQNRKLDSAKYEALLKPVHDQRRALVAEYKSKMPEERKNMAYVQTLKLRDQELTSELVRLSREFYKKHLDSEIGLKAFNYARHAEKDPIALERDFNAFSLRIRTTELGKALSNTIAMMLKTNIGKQAMNFTQDDVNGKLLQLSDFKGKYVLLDFWASWCKPCRVENPYVVKTFNQFKEKGFTVLSVSLDSGKDKWLEAIEKDGMPWYHVSDLNGWNNEVAKRYGIQSIPQNFLIDRQGKIVAKNLRGEELYKKVEEILGK